MRYASIEIAIFFFSPEGLRKKQVYNISFVGNLAFVCSEVISVIVEVVIVLTGGRHGILYV